MSQRLRIFGCLILGLLVLALAYERVVNASAEDVERITIPAEQNSVAAVSDHVEIIETGPVALSASAEPDEENSDLLAMDEDLRTLLAKADDAVAELLPADEDPLDSFDPNEVMIDGSPQPETPSDEGLTVPPLEKATVDPSTRLSAPSAKPNRSESGIKSLSNREAITESSSTSASRMLPDGVVFEEAAPSFSYRRGGRRIVLPDGSLRIPFKEMPSTWISSTVQPQYPDACVSSASEKETVVVRFRIDRRGRADHPKAALATNVCFNNAAVAATRRLRFHVRPPPGFSLGGSTFLVSYEFVKSDIR